MGIVSDYVRNPIANQIDRIGKVVLTYASNMLV